MARISISTVRQPADIEAATALAWEFIDFLRERLPHLNSEIDDYLVRQRFAEKFAEFPVHFNPPAGECLLARMDGHPVGILMMKPLEGRTAEVNRMYVRNEGRGHGIARRLCERLIERARDLGYDTVALSTLHPLHEAIGLYRSVGFQDDPECLAEGGKENPNGLCLRMAL